MVIQLKVERDRISLLMYSLLRPPKDLARAVANAMGQAAPMDATAALRITTESQRPAGHLCLKRPRPRSQSLAMTRQVVSLFQMKARGHPYPKKLPLGVRVQRV